MINSRTEDHSNLKKSPGWQPSSLHNEFKIQSRIDLVFPVIMRLKLASVIPIRLDKSREVIPRFFITGRRSIIIAIDSFLI